MGLLRLSLGRGAPKGCSSREPPARFAAALAHREWGVESQWMGVKTQPPVLIISYLQSGLEACTPYFRPLFKPVPICTLLGRNKNDEPACYGWAV